MLFAYESVRDAVDSETLANTFHTISALRLKNKQMELARGPNKLGACRPPGKFMHVIMEYD